MEFYEVLRQRRSIRGYQSTPVPQDKLDRVLEAVRIAPTACNLQPFRFLLIESPERKKLIADSYRQPWFAEAPVIVAALGSADKAWKRFNGVSAHTIDVAIAMEHLILAAAAEGLGTCWICAFDQEKAHRDLGLDPEWEVVALTPLGFPSVQPGPLTRKSIDEIVSRE